MQDKQSYNFVENLRDHLELHSQGDVIITHCNAGQKYLQLLPVVGHVTNHQVKDIFFHQN